MSAQPIPGLTPEQYLEIERAAEFKSEYYCGTMYAMAGGTYVRNLIIARMIFLLSQRFGCLSVLGMQASRPRPPTPPYVLAVYGGFS